MYRKLILAASLLSVLSIALGAGTFCSAHACMTASPGNGPCTACSCNGFGLSLDTSVCRWCGHHYDHHRNIHTPY